MKTSKIVTTILLVMTSFCAYAIPIDKASVASPDLMASTPIADCVTGACLGGDLNPLVISSGALDAPQFLLQHSGSVHLIATGNSTSHLITALSVVRVLCPAGNGDCVSEDDQVSVPEPGTLLLLGSGLLLLFVRRRKQSFTAA